ncbi:MAG: phage holin family protein [Microthrixaceae bacterium]
MIKRLALHLAISTGALLLLPKVVDGITVHDWKSAVGASLVIGVINVTIGPLLRLLSLPVRWLTLGLFTVVLNGFLLWIVPRFVEGFTIDTFWHAVLASLVYGAVNWLAGLILIRD